MGKIEYTQIICKLFLLVVIQFQIQFGINLHKRVFSNKLKLHKLLWQV